MLTVTEQKSDTTVSLNQVIDMKYLNEFYSWPMQNSPMDVPCVKRQTRKLTAQEKERD